MKEKAGFATRRIQKNEILLESVERYKPRHTQGLSIEQVLDRQEKKLTNQTKKTVGKSTFEIITANLFSFFNIILYVIAGALIAVKAYRDLFFLVILSANTLIGLIQDFRAKKTLEKLSILTKTTARVVRDGISSEIDRGSIVLDDVVILKMGDQIPADGVILHGDIKVNEALLTGESDILQKGVGDTILSGSFVTSGTAYMRVDKVGKLSYAQTIQLRAQAFKRPKSQLLGSIKSLFRVIGIIVFTIAALSIFSTIYQSNGLATSIRGMAGSLVGMIPSGMYLLTSMTLSVGVIRLGKKKTLVQEMYSIEMLARVDVLCLDKTGTLTDGTMQVSDIYEFKGASDLDLENIIANMLEATRDDNPTAVALKNRFKLKVLLSTLSVTPFSSESKYSSVQFRNGDTFYLGATSSLLNKKSRHDIRDIEENYTKAGLRVLVLTRTKKRSKYQDRLDATPVALIALEDHIREEAIDAIKWFIDNGVKIKIISGDDPGTVEAVSLRAGVIGAENSIDLSGLSNEEVEKYAETYTVFGRVKPNQKEILVRQMQKSGLVVGMIGDGVNDVLALKAADCSIAMANGSGAARGVSNLIIEQNFDALPSIVDEGRRSINNLQRTWSLFLVKTMFAIIVSFMFIVASTLAPRGGQIQYPFTTKNLYLWEFFTIGIAGFLLSLQPNSTKIKGTFMGNVVKKSLPGAVVMVMSVFIFFLMRNVEIIQPGSLRVTDYAVITMSVLTITFISFVVLLRTSWPLDWYRGTLFFVLLAGAITALSMPSSFVTDFFDIDYRDLVPLNYIELAIVNILAIVVYFLIDFQLRERKKKRK